MNLAVTALQPSGPTLQCAMTSDFPLLRELGARTGKRQSLLHETFYLRK